MTVPSKLSALLDQYHFLTQNTPNSALLPAYMDIQPLMSHFEYAAFLPLAMQCLETSTLPRIRLIRSIRAKLQQRNVISQSHAGRYSSYQIVYFSYVIPNEVMLGPRQYVAMLENRSAQSVLPTHASPFLLTSSEHPASFHAVFLCQMYQYRELTIGTEEWRLKTLKAMALDCAAEWRSRERAKRLQRISSMYQAYSYTFLATYPLMNQLIVSTYKAITDTLACSSIYSELVSTNLRQKYLAQRLLNYLKPTYKSHALQEVNVNIQKRKIRGVLVDVFYQLPFSGPYQKFNATLPNNKPAERAALVYSLAALRLRERIVSLRVPEPGSANLLIKQFLYYNNKKTGLLLSAASHIKSLDFPRNVRIFPFNRMNMRNVGGSYYEMYQFNNYNIRVNFYGERKAEQNFDLVDLDLVTVDFEYVCKCKKIDFLPVLKELGKSYFDFAIVNRFDSFRAQRKMRYAQLVELHSEFILNVLGDTGPMRNFAAACLSAKFDPELLGQFQPEILQNELNYDESLLKKLEKAARDYLEGQLLTAETATQEAKATTQILEVDCGQGSDLECLKQMKKLFYETEESDLRTQITTYLNRINTQLSDVEEESEENALEMVKSIRNNLISCHGQQQTAPDDVAQCLKGDTTFPCAQAVISWLDGVEMREKAGVRASGFYVREIHYQVKRRGESLIQSLSRYNSYAFFAISAYSLNAEFSHAQELPDTFLYKYIPACNYDNYHGPLGAYGRSLGIYIKNDIIYRIGVKLVDDRRRWMVGQYNGRLRKERLRFCEAIRDWRFLEEYLQRAPQVVQSASLTHISALEESENASVISQAEDVRLLSRSKQSFRVQLEPSFHWEFKFQAFFQLCTPRDLSGNTHTFFFMQRDIFGQPEPEFLELDNDDFACQQFPHVFPVYPNVLARQMLRAVDLGVRGRKYAIINDFDGSMAEYLQNYKAKVHVMRDLVDNAYTDVFVLPGDMYAYMIQNLQDLSGKVERIYEIRIKTQELAQNQAIACCQIVLNSIDGYIRDKVANHLKSQKFSYSLAKPLLSAANCLETVDIKEKAVSEEYFKQNYIQKCPTMAARKFVENVYNQFDYAPDPIEYASSYEEMLVALQQRITFAFNAGFSYLNAENDKKSRQSAVQLLFGTMYVEASYRLRQHLGGSLCCYLTPLRAYCNFLTFRSNGYQRLRAALNPLAHNKLYSQVDMRRDNYQVLISVPVFIETAPFKRFLCPRCCIYNDLWSTCFHLIQQCARVSLPQSRCRAEGNFMFPDIYFYNSYMHLYRGSIYSIISSDISTIILIMQITKQNKDYIQHTINEKLINMIFSYFAEPVSNTCNPVVLQTKLVVQSAFAQAARCMRSYPSVMGPHQKLTLRQTHLVTQFEMKTLKNLRNSRQMTYLQAAEAIFRTEQQKTNNSPVGELLQPLLGHIAQFGKDQLRCDLITIAELSYAPLRAVYFQNNFAEYAQAAKGCLKAPCDFNNCVEIVTRNYDQLLSPGQKSCNCVFNVYRPAFADKHQEFDVL